ncbi:hypothetical protein [Nostoc sp. MS1]|uniref:hypothetical protein n=1 Tax=Nostoc sp. MS1 TaxID=2764711 RepID=UPI001CC5DEEF|nr:hypothetical protein [Nostoc sp. MS1]BCL40004.1 hypothetical protein NSMS1_64510 [Nostoc sp. MS1]
MAKRVPQDDKPYRPVDEALVRSVLKGSTLEQTDSALGKNSTEFVEDVPIVETVRAIPEQPISLSPVITSEKLSREKRVLLTKSEEREIERFVDRLAEQLETPLKLSHVLRACMTILRHAEKEILAEASQSLKLERPPNGDPVALAQFEYQIAQILSTALSKTSALEGKISR